MKVETYIGSPEGRAHRAEIIPVGEFILLCCSQTHVPFNTNTHTPKHTQIVCFLDRLKEVGLVNSRKWQVR
jgi:hypothetical protein